MSSAFLWGDAEKKEHRQWTGPEREGGMKRGKGKKEAKGEEHARRQRSMDGKPVHTKHQCVAADCHCHTTAILWEDESGKWDPDENWDEDNAAGHDPWDSHIAGMIYARELMEGNNTIISRREKFRQVSCTWHRF